MESGLGHSSSGVTGLETWAAGQGPGEPGMWVGLGRSQAEEGAARLPVGSALRGPASRAAVLLSTGSFWAQHLMLTFLLLLN